MKGLEGGMTVKKAWQDENQGEKDPFKMKRKKKKGEERNYVNKKSQAYKWQRRN